MVIAKIIVNDSSQVNKKSVNIIGMPGLKNTEPKKLGAASTSKNGDNRLL